MNVQIQKGKNIILGIILFALLVQVFGTIRYIIRLPNDWLGIGLYLITIILFSITFGVLLIRIKNQA